MCANLHVLYHTHHAPRANWIMPNWQNICKSCASWCSDVVDAPQTSWHRTLVLAARCTCFSHKDMRVCCMHPTRCCTSRWEGAVSLTQEAQSCKGLCKVNSTCMLHATCNTMAHYCTSLTCIIDSHKSKSACVYYAHLETNILAVKHKFHNQASVSCLGYPHTSL